MAGLSFPTYNSRLTFPDISLDSFAIIMSYNGENAGAYRLLVATGTVGVAYLAIEPVNNYVGILLNPGSLTPTFLSFGAAIVDDTDYDIYLTVNSTTATLYLNGSLVGTVTDAGVATLTSTYPMSVLGNGLNSTLFPSSTLAPGSTLAPDRSPFANANGVISDIAVYNYAQTLEQIFNSTRVGMTAYNCTLVPNGLAIEEATTNLLGVNAAINTYNNYGVTSTNTYLGESFFGQPIKRISLYVDTDAHRDNFRTSYANHGAIASPSQTYTINTYYVASIYWRSSRPSLVVEGSPSNVAGWGSFVTIDVGNGWHRSLATMYNTTATVSDSKFWGIKDPTVNTGETIYVDWSSPQIEQKTFATAFTPTSRAAGYIPLPAADCLPNLNSWSISFKFFWEGTKNSGWQMYLEAYSDAGQEYDKINIAYNSGVKYIYTRLANSAASTWNSTGFNPSVGMHTYSISFDGTTFLECLDSTVQSATPTYKPGVVPTNLVLGSWSASGASLPANSTMSDVVFYNRALTSSELIKLGQDTMRISNVGDLVTTELNESLPIPTGSNLYYFPLDDSSRDRYHEFGASTETNIIYEDSSAWVGTGTTNTNTKLTTGIFNSAFDGSHYGFGSGTDIQQQVIPGLISPDTVITKISRINGGIQQADYVSPGIACAAGSVSIISFWYYGTFGTQLRPYLNDSYVEFSYLDSRGNWVKGTTQVNIPVVANRWQRITIKLVNLGTANTWSWMILHSNSASANLSNSEYWLFTNWQVEVGPYNIRTPFVAGTIGAGILKYTPSQLGIDVNNSSWTFACMIKPNRMLMQCCARGYTSAVLDGTKAVLTFSAAATYPPYPIGASVYFYGFTPTSLNENHVVLACTTTSVTIASTETAITVYGGSSGLRFNPLEIGSYYTAGSTSITMFHESNVNAFNGAIYDNQVGKTAPAIINPGEDGIDDWIMASFRYDLATTTLTMSIIPNNGVITSTSVVKNWTAAIGDSVYLGGYGWSAGNYYVRDFIAAGRVLTDAELTNIYSRPLRITSSGATVPMYIEEGL